METYVVLTYVDGALVSARECESVADVLSLDGGEPIEATPEMIAAGDAA